MAIVKAETVFTTAAGFTAEELERIGTAAEGKTVAFPKGAGGEGRGTRDEEAMLTEFARGKTGEEVAKAHGMSRRQVFYLLRKERAEGLKGSRVEEWKGRGLSLREIGRLYGKSHEAVRQMGEVEVKVEVESGGGEADGRG